MKKVPLLAGLLLGGASPVYAEINFNGFASVYAGYFDSEAEGEARELQGHSEDIDFKQDSLAALQFSADLGEGLSATAQIVARGEDDFEPEMEWAFIGYQFNDTWKVNVGRIRIPLFQYSDYLDVGYAYHWTKVPELIYGHENVPVSSFEGFNAIADYSAGNWDFSGNIFSNGDQFFGVNWSASTGDFSSRIIYAVNKATLPIPPSEYYGAYLEASGLGELSEDITTDNDSHWFGGLAASYDPGNWFVMAEYTMYEWDPGVVPDTEAWFASAGMRFGDWTPHITYSYKESTPHLDVLDSIPPNIPLVIQPPQIAPFFPQPNDTLAQGIESYFMTEARDQTEIIIGARYDFHAAAALKMDIVLHSDDLDDQNDGTLFRLGMDMVF